MKIDSLTRAVIRTNRLAHAANKLLANDSTKPDSHQACATYANVLHALGEPFPDVPMSLEQGADPEALKAELRARILEELGA